MLKRTRRAPRWRRPTGRLRQTLLGALLGVSFLVAPAWGAEVRGRITLANGQPAANEPIMVGRTTVGRTDVAGVYWLNLPAGQHVLTVKNQNITIQVSPNGSRRDIQLK